MMDAKIVVLTPVRDEEWIIKAFLDTASLFADYILICDQGSKDKTIEIARQYPKVKIFNNPSAKFNELERQQLLIAAAREITDSPRILIALDADEILTPEALTEEFMSTLKSLEPGSYVSLNWANITHNLESYWTAQMNPIIFFDDGSPHTNDRNIHVTRVPTPEHGKHIHLEFPMVMHFQYTNVNRLADKQAWYQIWENINNPTSTPLSIYRRYHHVDELVPSDLSRVHFQWFDEYTIRGTNILELISFDNNESWITEELKEYASTLTKSNLAKLDVLEAPTIKSERSPKDLKRNFLNDVIFRYLAVSQRFHHRFPLRLLDMILNRLWR